MNDLLTAREVQDLLKIDRTTVYRMLKDGRLHGVKIGLHWRFPRAGVEALLGGAPHGEPETDGVSRRPQDVLPLHCIQPIQNVFAEVAGVGAVTAATDGTPLTDVSSGCRFCELMLASESGRQACQASWRRLAERADPGLHTCHAGLQYASAPIDVDGEPVALLIAGQVYATAPDPMEAAQRVQRLAGVHGIDPEALADAACSIPILEPRSRARLGGWLKSVATTFSTIAHERAELVGRLRRIAEITTLE